MIEVSDVPNPAVEKAPNVGTDLGMLLCHPFGVLVYGMYIAGVPCDALHPCLRSVTPSGFWYMTCI